MKPNRQKPLPPLPSIEVLRQYRAKGIPLTPRQKEALKAAAQQSFFIRERGNA